LHGAYDFLKALTTVLCVAAVTTVLFHKLRLPVVLGYILAGLIIGPHVPIPLVASPEIIRTLSELGVILVMFSLGLEFSIRRLLRLGPTAGVTALIECSLMSWLGFVAGQLLGWTAVESIFAGVIVAISSTTIVAKAFEEGRVGGKLREVVVGILIVEDLIAILLMALLTGLARGSSLSAEALGATLGRLAGFLVMLVVVGLLVVPRAIRAVVRLGKPETTLITSIGVCFGVAVLAHAFGYSVALGAFVAGSLVAESGEGKQIEHLVQPVRDVFAAVFFVSVGMTIEPAVMAREWPAIVTLTLIVLGGKIVGVSTGAFLTGNGIRTSVAAGMSLAQIGEFSFIIAGLGTALGAVGGSLFPVAVAVSAITALATPWLIRASGPAASFVDRKLPRPVQTFAVLHGSWLERLRSSPPRSGARARARRLVRNLFLDTLLLTAVVVAASLLRETIARDLAARLGISQDLARVAVLGGALALALPLLVGVFRISQRLGAVLAGMALPSDEEGRVDLATAPRRVLVVAMQLALVLAAGLPVVAVTVPFLPRFTGAIALLLVLIVLGVMLWRSAANLQGHVRAGAEVIVEALAAQTADPAPLTGVRELLPGMGEPVTLTIDPASPSVGRSLAEVNLRGSTGATILAIHRAGGAVTLPTAREVLHAGDVLALAGSQEAIDAARQLLEPVRSSA
jgi:CPA2 family monovalent cation:H+ antiporter-2